VYSLCEWGRANPAAWGGETANLWRVSADIRDGWHSILSRAAIDASLWRYAGAGGWNDPDMLEVGNGACSFDEYKAHFSMWAMLKAPLIIGNDVRTMTTEDDDETWSILSNKDIIAVNQDSLGWQARRIWSDRSEHNPVFSGRGDRLIATKCASPTATSLQQDAEEDQQWTHQEDGTLRSHSTGHCLVEVGGEQEEQQEERHELLEGFLGTGVSSISELDFSLGKGRVTTADCSSGNVTAWDMGRKTGGAIISRASGLCLEVEADPLIIFTDGKRLQTGPCMPDVVKDHKFLNIRENQGWTQPTGTKGARLMNLYQRQCLTVDRDAPLGLHQEIWSTSLANGDLAVMMLNKGQRARPMSVSWEQLGMQGVVGDGAKVVAYDLWAHAEAALQRPRELTATVAPHGVAMFRLSVEKKLD
jgi:hypothetical protein